MNDKVADLLSRVETALDSLHTESTLKILKLTFEEGSPEVNRTILDEFMLY